MRFFVDVQPNVTYLNTRHNVIPCRTGVVQLARDVDGCWALEPAVVHVALLLTLALLPRVLTRFFHIVIRVARALRRVATNVGRVGCPCWFSSAALPCIARSLRSMPCVHWYFLRHRSTPDKRINPRRTTFTDQNMYRCVPAGMTRVFFFFRGCFKYVSTFVDVRITNGWYVARMYSSIAVSNSSHEFHFPRIRGQSTNAGSFIVVGLPSSTSLVLVACAASPGSTCGLSRQTSSSAAPAAWSLICLSLIARSSAGWCVREFE